MSSEASREAALEAARAILLESGPQAVTLKAVAQRIGRTHANLLHHFGTAAGLQSALATSMAQRITATIGQAVLAARAGEIAPRVIADLTFDAFDAQGAGALASWMILSGDRAALDPILAAIHRLVDEIADPAKPVPELTLGLILIALGDALLGGPITDALGLPREAARTLATERLLAPYLPPA